MTLELVATISIADARRIDLCIGDLARLQSDDGIDLVVVSAFRDDYVPTRGSLVGALYQRGVDVGALAANKLVDLRSTTRCWVSTRLDRQAAGFAQLLCFEPDTAAEAPEVVGNLFRALVPLVGGPDGIATVAMPLLASGDMAQDPAEMLTSILTAAMEWMAHGLALERLAIVVRTPDTAAMARRVFTSFAAPKSTGGAQEQSGAAPPFDVFISYADTDGADIAEFLHAEVERLRPHARIFRDRNAIVVGASWQQNIWDSLDSCRRVVTLITPSFVTSKVCQEEFNIALVRHRDSPTPVLFPLYVRSVDHLPAHLRAHNYADCREAKHDAVSSAAAVLVADLGSSDSFGG